MCILFIIHPCILPSNLNVPTPLMIESLLVFSPAPLLSHHFHCYSCFSLLSSDIFKPSPWGEQKPASIWNQLFCSVHESRTKPRQKNSCKDRSVICLCPTYRLCCYQSIYCAAVLQLWMQGGKPCSTSKLSQIWSGGQMARNALGTNEISTNFYR